MISIAINNLIQYMLLFIIASIGLPLGLVLAAFAPDEAHLYKKIYVPIQLILLVIFFITLTIYNNIFVSGILIILSFFFMFLYWKKRDHNILDYIVFSTLFIFFFLNTNALLYATIILFLFGLSSGFLYYVLHTKNPNTKKYEQVKIHNHSGKHKKFETIFFQVIKEYYFIYIILISVIIISNIASLLI